MLKRNLLLTSATAFGVAVLGGALRAQGGRGGSEWTTSGFDAQRTGWVRTYPRISADDGQGWRIRRVQVPLEAEAGTRSKAATALTAPVLLDRIIGFRGFKSIAFVATQSRRCTRSTTTLARRLEYHINYTASLPPVRSAPPVPGRSVHRALPAHGVAPAAAGGRGGGGGGGGTHPAAASAAGQGSLTLMNAGRGPGGAAAAPAQGVTPAPGMGRRQDLRQRRRESAGYARWRASGRSRR
jgi:hypothetical protein